MMLRFDRAYHPAYRSNGCQGVEKDDFLSLPGCQHDRYDSMYPEGILVQRVRHSLNTGGCWLL